MPETDDLLTTIEAIHAAGLDAEHWPKALAATAQLLGGSGATMEVYGADGGVLAWHGVGIPSAEQLDYVEHYARINPRANAGLRMRSAELLWDYRILDEAAMDRDPYYNELLPRTDFRYFLSARLTRTRYETAFATVQRTRRQGHVTPSHIALMRRLLPHFRQARDVAVRLGQAASSSRSLEGALEWLVDGVALVARDGAVLYANDALQDMARGDDGFAIRNGAFAFASSEVRARFAQALAAAVRLAEATPDAVPHDFPVNRPSGASPYLMSLRPLPRDAATRTPGRAAAMAFVRDPLRRSPAAGAVLREVFGFTEAEAKLARALQSGTPLVVYARDSRLSLNTVYTHLRRLKEKAGCKRLGELVHKLDDLQIALRID
jgi:DNA-binding CsgD family transcriptional regulator